MSSSHCWEDEAAHLEKLLKLLSRSRVFHKEFTHKPSKEEGSGVRFESRRSVGLEGLEIPLAGCRRLISLPGLFLMCCVAQEVVSLRWAQSPSL